MKKLFLLLTLCLPLVLASCVKPVEDYSISISGTVNDADSGDPLQGVMLTLIPSSKNCFTGSNGYYEFADLEAQKYTISAQKAGYITDRKSVNANAGENVEITFALKKTE